MTQPSNRQQSHLFSRYGQQWEDIITRQWAEVWKTTTSRTSQNGASSKS